MRKFYLFTILFFFCTTTVIAEQRSVEDAAAIAASFSTNAQQQKSGSRVKKAARKTTDASEMRLIHQVAKPNSNEPALYVFNKPEGGWVIVSADDQSTTILGYSDKGTFDGTKENVAYFLNYYAENIANARPLTDEEKAQRKASAPRRAKAQTETDVEPLLDKDGDTIQWNQNSPWNDMCPIDRYDDSRSATGCVATAAAMVMRFWKWPNQGIGEYSYVWNNKFDYDETVHHPYAGFDTVLYANFGATTYDWDNILGQYKDGEYNQTQAEAVALLNYHVGVICRMDYGGYAVGGSGSDGKTAGQGMINHFRYKAIKHFSQGNDCDFDTIAKYFSLDLHAGRPVMMGGAPRSGEGSGHAFVCDGMKDFDGEMLYHINWGWGGQSDGYFVLTTLDPDVQGIGGNTAAGGFAAGIGFWYGLEPDHNPTLVTGISLDETTLTLDPGKTKTLTATISPSNASSQGMYWTSSNEKVATINYKGKVTAISAGSAVITVKTADGGYTATCNVTVTGDGASSDTINLNFSNGVDSRKYVTGEPHNFEIALKGTEASYYPYMYFCINADNVNWRIAGFYEIGKNGARITGWLTEADYNSSRTINAKSGWFNISHTASGKYKFEGVFFADDNNYYKFSNTVSLENIKDKTSGTEVKHTLTDPIASSTQVTWLAQGQEFARNTALTNRVVLPSGKPASCSNGRVFVGWSATEVEATNTKPVLVKDGDVVNSNATYYAVYAEHTEALREVASVKFNKYPADGDNLDVSNLMDSLMVYDNIGIQSFKGNNIFLGKDGVIFGASKPTGWMTLTLDKPATIKKVIVTTTQFDNSSKKCRIRVIAGGSLIGTVQAPGSDLEFIANESVVSDTIKIATSVKEKRAYVSAITILTDEGSYSNYSTSCSGTASNPDIVTPVNKNGLIIVQDRMRLDLTETRQLLYVVAPYGYRNQEVTWVSSNPSIASVDNNGVVTGISAGYTTITGTSADGGFTNTCIVTVRNKPYRIELPFTGVFEHSYSSSQRLMTIGLEGKEDNYYPYMYLKFRGDYTNWKIAGTYQLDGTNYIDGWLHEAQYNLEGHPKTTSTDGWINITCVEVGKYRIRSEFTGDDGNEYRFEYIASVENLKKSDGTKYTLTDQPGDGPVDSVFFVSLGDTVASTHIVGGKVVFPATNPTNCSSKSFVGWTEEQYYESNNIAPKLVKEGSTATADATYYAVFGDIIGTSGPLTQVASIVFEDSVGSEDPSQNTNTYWYDDAYGKKRTDLIESKEGVTDIHGYSLRAGEHGIRIGSTSSDEYGHSFNGWVKLDLSQSATITKVVTTFSKTREDDLGELYVDLGDVHDPTPISEGEDVEYIPEIPVTTNSVKLSTEKKAEYIKSVKIYAGGTTFYENYTTICQGQEVPHDISTTVVGNGTVATGDVTSATAGTIITITATPADDCNVLTSISVKDADNNDVTITNNTFEMPNSDVTISATFSILKYTVTTESDANGAASINE